MDISDLLKKPASSGMTLMIIEGEKTLHASDKEGISPLLDAVKKNGLKRLHGSLVVDRVVGKAAALVITYFEAAKIYTKLASKRGASVLVK